MKYHVQTIWYNLEGDGFSTSAFVEARDEDEACRTHEAVCMADPDEVSGFFTMAELFY